MKVVMTLTRNDKKRTDKTDIHENVSGNESRSVLTKSSVSFDGNNDLFLVDKNHGTAILNGQPVNDEKTVGDIKELTQRITAANLGQVSHETHSVSAKLEDIYCGEQTKEQSQLSTSCSPLRIEVSNVDLDLDADSDITPIASPNSNSNTLTRTSGAESLFKLMAERKRMANQEYTDCSCGVTNGGKASNGKEIVASNAFKGDAIENHDQSSKYSCQQLVSSASQIFVKIPEGSTKDPIHHSKPCQLPPSPPLSLSSSSSSSLSSPSFPVDDGKSNTFKTFCDERSSISVFEKKCIKGKKLSANVQSQDTADSNKTKTPVISRKIFQENLLPLASYDAETDSFKSVEGTMRSSDSTNILHSPKVLFSSDIPEDYSSIPCDGDTPSRKYINFEKVLSDTQFFKAKLQDVFGGFDRKPKPSGKDMSHPNFSNSNNDTHIKIGMSPGNEKDVFHFLKMRGQLQENVSIGDNGEKEVCLPQDLKRNLQRGGLIHSNLMPFLSEETKTKMVQSSAENNRNENFCDLRPMQKEQRQWEERKETTKSITVASRRLFGLKADIHNGNVLPHPQQDERDTSPSGPQNISVGGKQEWNQPPECFNSCHKLYCSLTAQSISSPLSSPSPCQHRPYHMSFLPVTSNSSLYNSSTQMCGEKPLSKDKLPTSSNSSEIGFMGLNPSDISRSNCDKYFDSSVLVSVDDVPSQIIGGVNSHTTVSALKNKSKLKWKSKKSLLSSYSTRNYDCDQEHDDFKGCDDALSSPFCDEKNHNSYTVNSSVISGKSQIQDGGLMKKNGVGDGVRCEKTGKCLGRQFDIGGAPGLHDDVLFSQRGGLDKPVNHLGVWDREWQGKDYHYISCVSTENDDNNNYCDIDRNNGMKANDHHNDDEDGDDDDQNENGDCYKLKSKESDDCDQEVVFYLEEEENVNGDVGRSVGYGFGVNDFQSGLVSNLEQYGHSCTRNYSHVGDGKWSSGIPHNHESDKIYFGKDIDTPKLSEEFKSEKKALPVSSSISSSSLSSLSSYTSSLDETAAAASATVSSRQSFTQTTSPLTNTKTLSFPSCTRRIIASSVLPCVMTPMDTSTPSPCTPIYNTLTTSTSTSTNTPPAAAITSLSTTDDLNIQKSLCPMSDLDLDSTTKLTSKRWRLSSFGEMSERWDPTPPSRSVSSPNCMEGEVRGRGHQRSNRNSLVQQSMLNLAKEGRDHQSSVLSGASMVFNNRTSLPTQSSPAPLKRNPGGHFDYDASLINMKAIKNAFSCSKLVLGNKADNKEDEDKENCSKRTLSTSAPASTNCLLGNFEESILNGRIDPVGTVSGFTAEIGASGSFCPKHIYQPVSAFFFDLSDDNAPSPYLGHINLRSIGSKKGYHIPKKGTVQVTLFNPNKTVVKMFVVMYDLSDMPFSSQTFIRQRTMYVPCDRNATAPAYLRYLIHLRCASTRSGKIYLHTDIRLIFARHKLDIDAKTVPYEMRSFTELPKNPKYSPKK